ERLPLESVLQQMASQGRVFVDYELAGIQTPAKPVAIFFESGAGDEPPLPAGPSQTEVDIIAGHTEDTDPSSRAARTPPRRDAELGGTQTPANPVAFFSEGAAGEAPPLPAGPPQLEVDIIAGHTEDTDPSSRAAGTRAGRDAEPPLVVSVENNLLTVRARQQP